MSDNRLVVEFDERKVDAIFAELDQCHLPGAAVGIAIGGRPVYRKGFGLASMELPMVLSPSTRMRIGSTTKHFTCFAFMLLCEDGKADIDDPIGKFLPELHSVARRTTPRQLMSCTGGLRDAHDINWQFSGTTPAVSSTDLLSFYRDIDDVNFQPGTGWIYSNSGFLLLSVAIERIAGRSLEDVLCERIFEPLGMTDTLLSRWDTDFIPNAAALHPMKPGRGYAKWYFGAANAGEGGMVSSIDDMLRWLANMAEPTVGSEATWALMKTPAILANGTSTHYALGLMTCPYRGVEMLYHGGGLPGGNTQMLKVPGAGLDVVIMANRVGFDVSSHALANKVLDACLPSLDPVEEASDRPAISGIFRSRSTGRVIQLSTPAASGIATRTRLGQRIASMDALDIPIEADDDEGVRWSARWTYSRNLRVTLMGDPAKPTSIELSDFGNLDLLTRIEALDKADLGRAVGRYRSQTTGTEASVLETDDGPSLRTLGRFGSAEFRLVCLADGIWRAKSTNPMQPWGGIVSFDDSRTTLCFSSYFTRGLPFRRCA